MSGAVVKALEWTPHFYAKTDELVSLTADLPGREQAYKIEPVTANSNFRLFIEGREVPNETTVYWPLDEAKARAQSDFDARIRSALVEPVVNEFGEPFIDQPRMSTPPAAPVTENMRVAACRALNERGKGNNVTICDVVAMLEAALSASPEPVMWLVTGGRTYADGCEISQKAAEVTAKIRNDGSRIVPLYSAAPELEGVVKALEKIAGADWCDEENRNTTNISLRRELRARQDIARAALSPAPEPVTVPDGWQLVPKEPTEVMKVLGCEYADPLGRLISWDPSKGDCTTREEVAGVYKAMLSASPTPPAAPATEEQAIRAHAHLIRCFADDINERNWDDKRLYIMRQVDYLVGELVALSASPSPVDSRDGLIERLVKALEAAQELAKVAEGLTSCRSDDEFVWGVQEKINTALLAAKEQQP